MRLQRHVTPAAMSIEGRNKLLRETANRFWTDLPPSIQAAESAVELANYAGTVWIRRDRLALKNPYSDDTLRGLLWRALKEHPFPPSERALKVMLEGDGDP